MHLHVVLALFAEHINHLANDFLRLCRWPLDNLHHSLLASLAALEFLFRNQDITRKEVTFGIEEGKVLLHLQDTHGLVVLTLQNLRDDSLFDMVLSASHESHLHTVAIQGKHRVALSHKDRLAAILRLERVLAVSLTDKGSLLHLSLQVQFIGAVANLRQPVVPCHLFHHVDGEHFHGVGVKFKGFEYLFKTKCLSGMCLKQSL